jgi:hypothetical protein
VEAEVEELEYQESPLFRHGPASPPLGLRPSPPDKPPPGTTDEGLSARDRIIDLSAYKSRAKALKSARQPPPKVTSTVPVDTPPGSPLPPPFAEDVGSSSGESVFANPIAAPIKITRRTKPGQARAKASGVTPAPEVEAPLEPTPSVATADGALGMANTSAAVRPPKVLPQGGGRLSPSPQAKRSPTRRLDGEVRP